MTRYALVLARVAGYHGDSRAFTRLMIEARVARQYLNHEWRVGAEAKKNGVACSCRECNPRGRMEAFFPPQVFK